MNSKKGNKHVESLKSPLDSNIRENGREQVKVSS